MNKQKIFDEGFNAGLMKFKDTCVGFTPTKKGKFEMEKTCNFMMKVLRR